MRTKLDGDCKPLPATSLSISVKCYETRVGRVNIVQSNVLVEYTKILWSKHDGVEFEPIGNLDFPFRISIPAKVAGFSTAAFVDYRCVWRLEAGTTYYSYFSIVAHSVFPIVLNHMPISGVGARQIRHFELPFIRYDVPICSPITPPSPPLLDLQTNKPRAPRIRYSIVSPQMPIGPLDLVSVSIHLLPVDHGVSIRSASIIVERRIQLHDQVSGSTTIPHIPIPPRSTSSSSFPKQSPNPLLSSFPKSSFSPFTPQEPLLNAESSTPSPSSSTPTIPLTIASESTPLLNPSSTTSSTKLVVNPIVGTESSGTLFRDENGVWNRTLTLQWPVVKSHSLWAIGETISSDLVTVKYFIRTKVCFFPPNHSISSDLFAFKFQIIVSFPSGTESIDLAEQELLIVSTNEAERQLALANYNQLHSVSIENTTRSKSKSPRRLRPNPEEPLPLPPVVDSTNPYGKPRSRRPHTSAGPRDKPMNFAGGTYGRPRVQEGGESSTNISGDDIGPSGSSHGCISKRRSELVVLGPLPRPDSRDLPAQQPRIDGWKPNFWPTNRANCSNAPGPKVLKNASSSSSSNSSSGREENEGLRGWEEELARIEKKSRKSSDLLGFFKRKRSEGVL